mgnify:CR=1 FL=1
MFKTTSVRKAVSLPPARGKGAILAILTVGHGATHWYNQGFQIIVAVIKEQFGLSATAADALVSARALTGAVVNIPAGVLTDTLRSRWNLLLALSLGWMGVASVLVGLAPTYVLVLITVALLGIGATTWHMPAITALSERFPDRRGFALATHGVGGNAGDAIGPLAIGALLVLFAWRDVLFLTAIVPIVLAVSVFFLLRGLSGPADASHKSGRPAEYIANLKGVFRNRALILLAFTAGIRSMSMAALTPHLTFYMKEDFGMSTTIVGLYLALMTALGVVSSPVLGVLSDRLGRKPVLLTGHLALAALSLALPFAAPGWQLAAVLAAMGLFLYSLQAIVVAAAMDMTGEKAGATTVALMFTGNRLAAAISPIIAGLIVDATHANTSAFYFSAGTMFLSSLLLAVIPLRRGSQATA